MIYGIVSAIETNFWRLWEDARPAYFKRPPDSLPCGPLGWENVAFCSVKRLVSETTDYSQNNWLWQIGNMGKRERSSERAGALTEVLSKLETPNRCSSEHSTGALLVVSILLAVLVVVLVEVLLAATGPEDKTSNWLCPKAKRCGKQCTPWWIGDHAKAKCGRHQNDYTALANGRQCGACTFVHRIESTASNWKLPSSCNCIVTASYKPSNKPQQSGRRKATGKKIHFEVT